MQRDRGGRGEGWGALRITGMLYVYMWIHRYVSIMMLMFYRGLPLHTKGDRWIVVVSSRSTAVKPTLTREENAVICSQPRPNGCILYHIQPITSNLILVPLSKRYYFSHRFFDPTILQLEIARRDDSNHIKNPSNLHDGAWCSLYILKRAKQVKRG